MRAGLALGQSLLPEDAKRLRPTAKLLAGEIGASPTPEERTVVDGSESVPATRAGLSAPRVEEAPAFEATTPWLCLSVDTRSSVFRAVDRERIRSALASDPRVDWVVLREVIVAAIGRDPRLRASAEDLAQEALLRCWRNVRSWAAARDPAAFLAVLLRRLVRDQRRPGPNFVELEATVADPRRMELAESVSWPQLIAWLRSRGLSGQNLIAFVLRDVWSLERARVLPLLRCAGIPERSRASVSEQPLRTDAPSDIVRA